MQCENFPHSAQIQADPEAVLAKSGYALLHGPEPNKNHWTPCRRNEQDDNSSQRRSELRALALGDGPSRRIPCSVSTLCLKNAKVPILLPYQHHRATGPVRQMASPFTLKRSQITMSRWKPLLLRQLSAKSLLGDLPVHATRSDLPRASQFQSTNVLQKILTSCWLFTCRVIE